MANSIDINIKAVDNASRQLKEISASASDLGNAFNKFGTMASIALTGLVLGTTALVNQAGKFEGLAQGFTRNFGQMTESLNALRTASAGTISDMDLMATANRSALLGVTNDVNKLSQLMVVARIRGREMGMSTTQAFNDIVAGIGRGSPLILDNLGINIPTALRATMEGMTDVQKKQALLNYALEDGANIMKQYGNITLTASEQAEVLKAEFHNQAIALGQALQPAWSGILNAILPYIKTITLLIKQNPELIRQIATLATVILGTIVAIFSISKAWAMMTQYINLAKTAVAMFGTQAMIAIPIIGILLAGLTYLFARNVQKQMELSNGTKELTSNVGGLSSGFSNLGNSVSETGKKMSESLADASDRIAQIKQSIDEENKSYEEQLANMVNAKTAQINENKKLLSKEVAEFEKKQSEMTDRHKDEIEAMKEENSGRIRALERDMADSLIIGSSTYQQDLMMFTAMIEAEKKAGDDKLNKLIAGHQTETDELKAEYEERTNELKNKISEDEALLQKHAETIKGINLDVTEDEITELQRAHEERLKKLNEELLAEQNKGEQSKRIIAGINDFALADTGATLDSINGMGVDWNDVMGKDTLSGALTDTKNQILNGFLNLAAGVGTVMYVVADVALYGIVSLINGIIGLLNKAINGINSKISDVTTSDWGKLMGLDPNTKIGEIGTITYKSPWEKGGSLYDTYATFAGVRSQLPRFAEGGDFVTNGPQAIIVGDNPSGKERVQITPLNSGTTAGNGAVINNTFNNIDIDASELSRLLMFQLKTL